MIKRKSFSLKNPHHLKMANFVLVKVKESQLPDTIKKYWEVIVENWSSLEDPKKREALRSIIQSLRQLQNTLKESENNIQRFASAYLNDNWERFNLHSTSNKETLKEMFFESLNRLNDIIGYSTCKFYRRFLSDSMEISQVIEKEMAERTVDMKVAITILEGKSLGDKETFLASIIQILDIHK
jgi:hypothetical protein